jgi:hypothetical protein
MASFYAKTRKTASRLVGKFGAQVTITRTLPGGGYDPSTGMVTPGEKYIWTPFAVRTAIKQDWLTNSLISVGDMHLLVDCADQPYIPQQGDKVTFANGEEWTIVLDMPVDPAGVVVLYKGIIRK